jgi:hypothetical protein
VGWILHRFSILARGLRRAEEPDEEGAESEVLFCFQNKSLEIPIKTV